MEPAVVARRRRDLLVWVIERAAKMPREHKFTVGDKLVDLPSNLGSLWGCGSSRPYCQG
jgi:hypothetical protein